MVKPERAPLAVLERLAGTPLTDRAPAAAGAAKAV